jgi:hypothetical protein
MEGVWVEKYLSILYNPKDKMKERSGTEYVLESDRLTIHTYSGKAKRWKSIWK